MEIEQRGKIMTKTMAVGLQAKWLQQVEPPPCKHRKQELGDGIDGYLRNTYYCLECGEGIL
jgi:hypothetical protein